MSEVTYRGFGANAAPCNTTSLDRARMALSRDNVQRQCFLRARWQGRLKKPLSNPSDIWWEERLETPLGRALSQLAKV